jgi:serine/threonine-protein kinase HipA
MAVRSKNTHYQLARIQTRHWEGLAQRSGVEGTWQAMQTLVARVPGAIAAVQAQIASEQPAGFPQRMAEAIFAGLTQQARAWDMGH